MGLHVGRSQLLTLYDLLPESRPASPDVYGLHKVVKNKVAPPFKKAEFDILYGEGISLIGEIIDLGVEMGVIKKSGSWFSYNDSKLGQGRDALKRLLEENPELCEERQVKITDALNNSEQDI